jgi:mRNA-degrading endonuclease RelE of RelBE toxin-antitoxin system
MSNYTVELTPTAEKVYQKIYEDAQPSIKAGDTTSAKVKMLRLVDEAIDTLIPHDPFSVGNALAGPLSNTFRVSKGRLRIYYAASSKEHKIVILYISETPRKAGDANDPYSIFTRMVLSGRFDEVFEKLGVRIPPRQSVLHPPRFQ